MKDNSFSFYYTKWEDKLIVTISRDYRIIIKYKTMKLASIFCLLFSFLSVAQTKEAVSVEDSFKEDMVIVVERNLEKGYFLPYILYIPEGTKKKY